MRIFVTVILSLVINMPLVALSQDQLIVRSAEHPEYSRLLVTVPSGTSWAIAQDGRTATVSFPGVRAEFSMDQIFDRMPRTRIVAVEGKNRAIGAALDLTLACSCKIEVSRIGSRFLAVDVKRAEGNKNAPAGRRVLSASEPKGEPLETSADLAAVRESDQVPLATAPSSTLLKTTNQLSSLGPSQSGDAIETSPKQTPEASNLGNTRQGLVAQLTRAAEEGLIEFSDLAASLSFTPTLPSVSNLHPNQSNTEQPLLSTRELGKTSADNSVSAERPEMADIGDEKPNNQSEIRSLQNNPFAQIAIPSEMMDERLESQVQTRTPLDEIDVENSRTAVDITCPQDRYLDVREWGAGEPIGDEIGALRRALVSDYGTIDGQVVYTLAKYYISIGFGREAESILGLVPGMEDEKALLLRDLARVVEGREVSGEGVLTNTRDCVGRVSLWRAVAGMERLEPGTERSEGILAAFSELPKSLRRLVGEEIVRHTLEQNGADHADSIMRILDRTPGEMSAREGVVRARVASDLGRTNEAAELLDEIQQNANLEVDRLAMLLMQAEAVLEEGTPIPQTLFDDLESMKRHHRGGLAEGDVELALARLDFGAGNSSSAFERLRRFARGNPERLDDVKRLGRHGLRIIDQTTTSPTAFVRLVLQNQFILDGGRDGVGLRNDLAKDLLEKGLPNVALNLMEELPILPSSQDRRLLATALLATGQPTEALQQLEGLSDEAAARLRADAYVNLGAIENAFASLKSLQEDDPDRNNLALFSRNITEVSMDGLDPSLKPLTRILTFNEDDLQNVGSQQVEIMQDNADADDGVQPVFPTGDSNSDVLAEPRQTLTLAALQARIQDSTAFRSAISTASEKLAKPK